MKRSRFVFSASVLFLFLNPGKASVTQPVITTVAGGGPDQVQVADATIYPHGVFFDGSGSLYVTSQSQSRVFKISSSGLVTVAAGGGVSFYCQDGGPGSLACLHNPEGATLDSGGNLIIADTYNHRIRRVDSVTGIISTVAGTGVETGEIDGPGGNPTDELGDGGPATQATLRFPTAVAFDAAGDLFIADYANHRIRRVDATTREITTVAGLGFAGYSGDGGAASSAALDFPRDIAFDGAANLLIADQGNSRIRRIDAVTSLMSTVAGNGQPTGWIDGEGGAPADDLGDDGPAANATLRYPSGVATNGSGDLLITDSENHRIRIVEAATSRITTVAGNGRITGYIDGRGGDPTDDVLDGVAATSATLAAPRKAVFDAAGDIVLADQDNYRIRKVSMTTGEIVSLSGDYLVDVADGGPATRADFYVTSIATDAYGNLFIGQGGQAARVRRVDALSGIITTVAGCIDPSDCHYQVEGLLATRTAFGDQTAIAVSPAGELYIAQSYQNGVVKVDSAGFVRQVTDAVMNPTALAFDAAGNLYVGQMGYFSYDWQSQLVLRVDAGTGVITTVAGGGYGGDGGPAVGARLEAPDGLAVDADGNLYVAEQQGGRVRRVDAVTGIITTIAGTGLRGFGGDGGPAVGATLSGPADLAIDADGGLLVADSFNRRIRRIDLASGLIDTVAGSGAYGFGAEGEPALDAPMAEPIALAARPEGGFFVGDFLAHRVRLVAPAGGSLVARAGPDIVVAGKDPAGTSVTLDGSASRGPAAPLSYEWSGPFLEGGGTASGLRPTVTLPLGKSTISLAVSDGQGLSAHDDVNVTVTVRPVGLEKPLEHLVLDGVTPPLPRKAFQRGRSLPIRLRLMCGETPLTDRDVTAPRIVGLSRNGAPVPLQAQEGRGPLTLSFRGGMWSFSLGTRKLAAGSYEIRIEMPDGRIFAAGFRLR